MSRDSIPQRVVSLVPSTTETVCVLGAADRLVGCTRYCTDPEPALRSVPRIGGTKNPDLEAVLALAPDLVLANAEENRAEDLEALARRVPVLVQTPRTLGEAAHDLRVLAERLSLGDAALPFLLRLEANLAAVQVDALERPPLRVYYAIWRKPWMTVSGDTFIGDVLRRVGAVNIAEHEAARYPDLSPVEARARGVDLVLLASEPWEFDAVQRREIAAAATFGAAEVRLCDGRDFCWHGVRMADGLARARAVVAAPADSSRSGAMG